MDFPKNKLLNYKDGNGNTVLHLAVLESYDNFKKVLSRAECAEARCINAQNKDGDTPLHMAIKNNFLNIVKDLIEAGAKTNIKNKAGLDALGLARKEDLPGMSEYLESVMISIYD